MSDMSVRYLVRVFQGMCAVYVLSHTMYQWRSGFENKNGIQKMAKELYGISSGEVLLLKKRRSQRNSVYFTFLIIRDVTLEKLRYMIPRDSKDLLPLRHKQISYRKGGGFG